MADEITIIIEARGGRLLWSDLRKAIDQNLHAIDAVGRCLADRDELGGTWRIEKLSMNSPATALLAYEPSPSSEFTMPPQWLETYVTGIEQLETREVQPEGFSENAIHAVANLTTLVQRIEGITLVVGDRSVTATAAAPAHAVVVDEKLKTSRPAHYVLEGEIRGELGQITVHGKSRQFAIWDELTDRKIVCSFEDDARAVSEAIEQRVVAFGRIKYNRAHQPVSMEVESWHTRKRPEDLASLDQIRAALEPLPDGVTAEDFVGGLRRDE